MVPPLTLSQIKLELELITLFHLVRHLLLHILVLKYDDKDVVEVSVCDLYPTVLR